MLFRSSIKRNIDNLVVRLAAEGYQTSINTFAYYSLPVYAGNDDNMLSLMITVPVYTDGESMGITEGRQPTLANEAAMSVQAMQSLGISLGDRVVVNQNGSLMEYIICGSYSNFLQMGMSMMINESEGIQEMLPTGNWFYQCRMEEEIEGAEYIESLREALPELTFYARSEVLETQMGDIATRLDDIKIITVLIICGVNVLITILMVRIFLLSEIGRAHV